MNKPYLPSNGTEGMIWAETWCDNCSRRALDPGAKTQCVHEIRALSGENNKRWYYVDGVPTCVAFRDRSIRKKRFKKPDKRQMEMWTQ